MKRLSLICIPAVLFSCSMQAQTTDAHIKKLSKDPKTSENAAKADVYIVKKEAKIYDTAIIANKTDAYKKEKQPVNKKKN